MRILITGGAGFVGSNLAKAFQKAGSQVTAFDNLRRRGSELNLVDFKRLDIEFVHGDIRNPSDLADLAGNFDLLIEASAEPSVLAGLNQSPAYLLDTNLKGTMHCLDFALRRVKRTVFLSTSRVYSMAPLRELALEEGPKRFELKGSRGISERFPVDTARSLYGTTKLASEYLVQEYQNTYGCEAVIYRCGVIAGRGQFGKVDQGVFTLWMANHFFGRPLKYIGFGGTGKQVRDLLHPSDLYALIRLQLDSGKKWDAPVFNVGGGREISTSLLELTDSAVS